MRFETLSDFKNYKNHISQEQKNGKEIWICGGPGCVANGSMSLAEEFAKALVKKTSSDDSTSFWHSIKVLIQHEDKNPEQLIKIGTTGCMGPCENGPIVHVEPDGFYYQKVTVDDIEGILSSIKENMPYKTKAMSGNDGKPAEIPSAENIPFLAKQKKLVLGKMTSMSPLELEDHIAHGGYSALIKALESMTPEEVCNEVKASGLRGRGGGGFPTGTKWESCRKSVSDKRYVLVNGDEGDPGAFMDRALMEGDPYSVIEGLTIGAYAIGSSEGIIYVRHEYPLAVKRLANAITNLEEAGLLGTNILGTGFDFHVEICKGGGAFVCGESTALMTSIEGKPGVPRVKYIRSTEKGLWESPTVLNNVETWANVPHIIVNGAEWFRAIGSENNSGTKVFALVGKVRNTGLVEVPMGTTLREIIYDIGGGVAKNRPFKAVQTGGPSGGCLPRSMLDTPVDFDSLTAAGSMMGSGGMIVMDDRTCMVDIARYFIDFLVEESCGKCVPCREGLKKMQMILHDLTEGKGQIGDTDALEELAEGISDTSLCALGQSAANPVLSTIRYFKDEYIEHEKDHFCRSGVCKKMFRVTIDEDKCKSCGLCSKNCPVDTIEKLDSGKYRIKQEGCIKCGACFEVCPFSSVDIVKEVIDHD
ncbi:MAG: NADH-ubiquinone oxidoreductase-F iron-sulfur binding region domain-containing protein [Synergistaceae bacterium]|nr:NADH-ubiquinone oxidoreductase-F iron-sulfur binding region domain-containing protein [Synergistaceae bacterium]